MTKKKTMQIVGIGMMVLGIGFGAFGISMKSHWQSSAQVPKVYDWNTDGLGEAPEIDDSDDIQIESGESGTADNSVESSDASVSEDETDVSAENETESEEAGADEESE